MASISLKRRIDALEKAASAAADVTLEDAVRFSYLPASARDPEIARQLNESHLAKLVADVFGKGKPEPQTPTRATLASPVPRPEYVSVVPDKPVETPTIDGAPAPRGIDLLPPTREPELIKAAPGMSLTALMLSQDDRPPPARSESDLAKEAREKWVREQFGGDANRPRRPGL